MATRQEQSRELRRLLINKEAEIKREQARIPDTEKRGYYGEVTKLDRKIKRLKAEAKDLQSRISKRETPLQKQQREAASG